MTSRPAPQSMLLPISPDQYDQRMTQQTFVDIERRLEQLEKPANATAYTITNRTEDRTLDCDSTSTAELADVLGTLIEDLKAKGFLT